MSIREKTEKWNYFFKRDLVEIISGYNERNQFFTLDNLLEAARNLIDYRGGRTTLYKILKSIGLKYKIANDRKILCEQKHIKTLKIIFCRKFLQFQNSSENYMFVYLDETWIYQNGSPIRRWVHDTDLKFSPSKVKNEGRRYTILHAGCELGWLGGCDFLLNSKNNDRDYHKTMTGDLFQKWIKDQLIPALAQLKCKCVVVMDNAPYHSMLLDKPPTFASKKCEMQKWLTDRTQKDYQNLNKKQLWEVIKPFRRDCNKTYVVDELLRQQGHEVLRLPPYHCQFNPIEMAWHVTKDYYNKHINLQSSSMKQTEDLWLESLRQCTAQTWKNFCVHCENLVREEWVREMGQTSFEDMPPFIISLAESDSDSNEEEESDSDS